MGKDYRVFMAECCHTCYENNEKGICSVDNERVEPLGWCPQYATKKASSKEIFEVISDMAEALRALGRADIQVVKKAKQLLERMNKYGIEVDS